MEAAQLSYVIASSDELVYPPLGNSRCILAFRCRLVALWSASSGSVRMKDSVRIEENRTTKVDATVMASPCNFEQKHRIDVEEGTYIK